MLRSHASDDGRACGSPDALPPAASPSSATGPETARSETARRSGASAPGHCRWPPSVSGSPPNVPSRAARVVLPRLSRAGVKRYMPPEPPLLVSCVMAPPRLAQKRGDDLYAKIGQLAMKRDFLASRSGRMSVPDRRDPAHPRWGRLSLRRQDGSRGALDPRGQACPSHCEPSAGKSASAGMAGNDTLQHHRSPRASGRTHQAHHRGRAAGATARPAL